MQSSALENTGLGLTEELASFVHKTSYRDIAPEVIRLARGFILDGLGVIVAGSTEKGSRIVQEFFRGARVVRVRSDASWLASWRDVSGGSLERSLTKVLIAR